VQTIEVRDVTKKYGDQVAVDHLTFNVSKGEILGFLGPNGAGKTTTMRIITGFLPPTSGTVHVDGIDVLEEPLEVKERVGYLPQDAPVYPEMTVKHYLHFMAEMKGLNAGQIAQNVDRAVQQLELQPVYNRLCGNCSLGYRHRIGLAATLLGDPPILILDEPTSGLDPHQRIEIRELIRGLAGERTVILSSHVLPEVQQTCERVVIINDGRLVAEDTPSGLAAQLTGYTELKLSVIGAEDVISEVLSAIPGVQEVVPEPREDGTATFAVHMSPQRDIRADVFNKMVENNSPIVEMTPQGASLEDIFIQLTTEDPAQEPTEEEDSDE